MEGGVAPQASRGVTDWIVNAPTAPWRDRAREVWAYRELVWFLALRDFKVRYRQAVFGAAWAVVQPLAGTAVLLVVFRRVAGVPSEGVPYAVFALAGFLVWRHISSSVTRMTQSLLADAALVTKVYFPRVILPLAAALPPFVDLAIGLVVLGVAMALAGVVPSVATIAVPAIVVLTMIVAAGPGLLLSGLVVRYRDLNAVLTFAVELWFFASPVAYPTSAVPDAWRPLYALNPAVCAIEGFRAAVLGTPLPAGVVATSACVAVALLVAGLAVFARVERRFADVI
jgi:lipopolysaccharide transport system permease protein